MPIKIPTLSFGGCPLFVIDLSLFLQINVPVERIVVEFLIVYFLSLTLPFVSLVEDVHDLDCILNLFLCEHIANYNQRNIVLELLYCLGELLLWEALREQVNHKILIFVLGLFPQFV